MVTTSGCVLTRCKVRTGDCYCPTLAVVLAVVRALTAARIIGWSVWWSPGFGVPLGCGCFRAAAWETELGPSSRQSTEALRSLSFLVAVSVVRTWNLAHYFLYASYMAVTFPVCGCCLWSTALDFSEDSSATHGRFSWFDSDACSASALGAWTNCTHFLRCGRLES